MSIDPASVGALLSAFTPHDETEAAHLRAARALAAQTSACQRTHYTPGHFTASAFVLNADGHVGLILHPKLGIWLQSGGHLEPEDDGVAEAAARELLEETGVCADPARGVLFDIDVHQFPARGDDPAHLHFDLRFLFREFARGEASEANPFRWVDPREMLGDATRGESMKRPMRKVLGA